MFVGILMRNSNDHCSCALRCYKTTKNSQIILELTELSEIFASFSLTMLLADFTRDDANPCPLFIFTIAIVYMYSVQHSCVFVFI